MAWNTYSISKLKNWGVTKIRPKQDQNPVDQTWNSAALCLVSVSLGTNWAPTVLALPTSPLLPPITVSFLIKRLHALPIAFFHDHPMVLASPASLGLPCSLGLTFLASQYFSEPPCREFDLALLIVLGSFLESWKKPPWRCNACSERPTLWVMHQVLICVWNVVWPPFPTVAVACVPWQLNIMQTRP